MSMIDDVLVVGGGTAGWLTATYLARHLGANRPGGVRVTLVESSEIGILGVGEATFPTILKTLASIGVDEARFMRNSSATFKQGIRFVDWVRPPENGRHSHYYHPFQLPRPFHVPGESTPLELLPYWLLGEAGPGVSFAAAVCLQEAVCDAGRSPKRLADPGYRGPLNYAFHLDAGRFAGFLAEVGQELGVRRLIGTVEKVNVDETGAIRSLLTKEHGELHAGLYVDCTGFRGQLIGDALGVKYQPRNDIVFNDRAVAMQVPYLHATDPIAPYTISTAHEAGWTWDIGLDQRRGVGYVYSSRYTDDTRAEEILRQYIGPASGGLSARQLKFPIGWRERHWHRNCVAVGLSGGFMEPLESTGILLIEAAAYMLAACFPRAGGMEQAAKLYNQLMTKRYERILDFIKMHYCISQRRDSDYWRDNAKPESCPDSLLDALEMWRHRPPGRLDFVMDHETFATGNYQFVLYGMEFRTDLAGSRANYPHASRAREEFARVQQAARRAVAALPTHREVIERIHQAGFDFPEAPGEAPTAAALVR